MAMPDFAAGQKLTGALLNQLADQIDSLTAPTWTSYTPTWAASGTQPVLGNGTITGRYRRASTADLVIVEMRLVMGSTTTYGTGSYAWSLPFNASATSVNTSMGVAYFTDSGVLDRTGACRFSSATQVICDTPASGVVGQTTPITWGTADVLRWCIQYEPA